jgi:hypothetical protein
VAYNALRTAATSGGVLLTAAARTCVLDAVTAWDGSHQPLDTLWLDNLLANLPAGDRPAARLALLAALAPHRTTDAHVTTWRGAHHSDADLVRLLAFGAMAAVNRIEEWTAAAPRGLAAPAHLSKGST